MQMSDDLDFDVELISDLFECTVESPHVLIELKKEDFEKHRDIINTTFRRCYIDDSTLLAQAALHNIDISTLLSTKTPDPGSTMSGDFGEILTYLFQSCELKSVQAVGPKKWRLKQDRRKPTPYSDVVHFVMPDWPSPSQGDAIFCAEVKTKATNGGSNPIKSAIKDCEKDYTSRLSATLVWLRERMYFESLGDIGLNEINRFAETDKHPPYKREHRAVAVICSSLLAQELINAPLIEPENYKLIIIAVPDLKETYMSTYQSVANSTVEIDADGEHR